MEEVVLRTEDLPPDERFPYWQEMIQRSTAPYDIRSDHATGFRAYLRTTQLSGLHLSLLSQQALEARRTPRLIRRSDPEVYMVGLNFRGGVEMSQARSGVNICPGDLVVHESSRSFHTATRPGEGLSGGMALTIPRTLLPLPEREIRKLLLVPLPGRDGLGQMLGRFLLQILRDPGQYRAQDRARLATVALDLLVAKLAHELETDTCMPSPAAHKACLLRIYAFIDQNLGDPALTPSAVAAAHHLSTRTLHRIFRHEGTTVAAWIRTRRLEQCRRDLLDQRLRNRPIHAIAARWGFRDAAHFSRAFKTAYDTSPETYRHSAPKRTPSDRPQPDV